MRMDFREIAFSTADFSRPLVFFSLTESAGVQCALMLVHMHRPVCAILLPYPVYYLTLVALVPGHTKAWLVDDGYFQAILL